MKNNAINTRVYLYLVVCLIVAMVVIFVALNLLFSGYYYFLDNSFDFTWSKLKECLVLGILTGPIAASGIWLMLRYRM